MRLSSLLLISPMFLLSLIQEDCGECSGDDESPTETPTELSPDESSPTPNRPTSDIDEDGYSTEDGDCNDADPAVFPGAREVCNGIDDDCDTYPDDGLATAAWYPDHDGDGHASDAECIPSQAVYTCEQVEGHATHCGDCDDTDEDVSPGAVETCNGKDDDCDGQVDEGQACLKGGER